MTTLLEQGREWVLRSSKIKASSLALESTPERSRSIRLVRQALSAGDRILEPIQPLPEGPAPFLAGQLYRSALMFSFRALGSDAQDPSAGWSALTDEQRALLCDSEEGRARLEALLAQPAYQADASPEVAELDADFLRQCASQACKVAEGPLVELENFQRERAIRLGLVLFFSVLLLGLLGKGMTSLARGPDLAQGKPWRASSVGAVCNPKAKECGGAKTAILFHTKEEENPWFEIDLQKPTRVSRVDVENRRDYGLDRAVPLVIEVSMDRKTFTPVARKDDAFRSWSVSFSPVEARYVRLRVARRSALHLEGVAIRG